MSCNFSVKLLLLGRVDRRLRRRSLKGLGMGEKRRDNQQIKRWMNNGAPDLFTKQRVQRRWHHPLILAQPHQTFGSRPRLWAKIEGWDGGWDGEGWNESQFI